MRPRILWEFSTAFVFAGGRWKRKLRFGHFAEDGLEDAAVAVVIDFDGGVDAAGGEEGDFCAVFFGGDDLDVLAGFDVVVDEDVEGFGAVEEEG